MKIIIDAAVALLVAELAREAIVGRLWIVEIDRIRVYEPES